MLAEPWPRQVAGVERSFSGRSETLAFTAEVELLDVGFDGEPDIPCLARSARAIVAFGGGWSPWMPSED